MGGRIGDDDDDDTPRYGGRRSKMVVPSGAMSGDEYLGKGGASLTLA